MKITFPIEWDEKNKFEIECKGWLQGVMVELPNGKSFDLIFYDVVRLSQELEEEIKVGNAGIIENGLMVLSKVTKENIEKAIEQAHREGYFK